MPIQQGMNQYTPAMRALISMSAKSPRSGAKRTKKRTPKRSAASGGKSKKKSKLKFGSPAWQKKYKVGKFAKKK